MILKNNKTIDEEKEKGLLSEQDLPEKAGV